jgi:hypothetical protein
LTFAVRKPFSKASAYHSAPAQRELRNVLPQALHDDAKHDAASMGDDAYNGMVVCRCLSTISNFGRRLGGGTQKKKVVRKNCLKKVAMYVLVSVSKFKNFGALNAYGISLLKSIQKLLKLGNKKELGKKKLPQSPDCFSSPLLQLLTTFVRPSVRPSQPKL